MADEITKSLNRNFKEKNRFKAVEIRKKYYDISREEMMSIEENKKVSLQKKMHNILNNINELISYSFLYRTNSFIPSIKIKKTKEFLKIKSKKNLIKLTTDYNKFDETLRGKYNDKRSCIRCGKIFNPNLYKDSQVCEQCDKELSYGIKLESKLGIKKS